MPSRAAAVRELIRRGMATMRRRCLPPTENSTRNQTPDEKHRPADPSEPSSKQQKPRLRGASREVRHGRGAFRAHPMPSTRETLFSSRTSANYRLPFFPGFAGPVTAARMFAEGDARPRLPSVLVNGHTGVWRVVVFFRSVPAGAQCTRPRRTHSSPKRPGRPLPQPRQT
jgi:hypothetical protein